METLMVTPLVFLAILGGFQIMLVFAGRNAARDAANAAVIAGAVERGSVQVADTEARARVERAGGINLLSSSSVVVTTNAGTITCTVSGQVISMFGIPITVHQTATAPLERFRTPDDPLGWPGASPP